MIKLVALSISSGRNSYKNVATRESLCCATEFAINYSGLTISLPSIIAISSLNSA